MRNKVLIAVVIVVAIVVSATIPLLFSDSGKTKLGNKEYTLETATTPETRQRGLSGRESLDKESGMLFVFKHSGTQCIWMKDMRFSIDVVWLDSNQKVVQIEKNIAPNTFPNTFCGDNAQYVIELNAGQIREAKISRGQTIEL